MLNKIIITARIIRTIKNWPTYFLNYAGVVRRKKIKYTLRNGTRYSTRPHTPDFGTILEIWAQRLYTPLGFTINRDDIVVDIGAHIGIFTLFAAQKANHGKIYAFEPIPENFQLLKENILLNNRTTITPINKAMTNNTQQRELFISEKSHGVGSFYEKKGPGQKITVPTTTLAHFMQQHKLNHIDFLKLDCEGAEYDILLTCPPKILKNVKKISMEYHELKTTAPVEVLQNHLEKNGFTTVINQQHHMLYAHSPPSH